MAVMVNKPIASHVTKLITRRLRHLWRDYLQWPVSVWRLRGYARLPMAGQDFTFRITGVNLWWAQRVWDGRWETSLHGFLQTVLRPGDVFFDIGAYMGDYTVLAARLVQPGGRVYCFEPDPVARELLDRNVAANAASGVTVLPYVVTDHDGSATLGSPSWSGQLGTSASAVTTDGSDGLPIEAVTLSGFCRRRNVYPSVMKITAMGEEPKVFAEAKDVIQQTRVVVVHFEADLLRRAGADPDSFFQSLFDFGRRVTVIYQKSDDGPQPGTELHGRIFPVAA
jgi:FkbM family methyltransferase